ALPPPQPVLSAVLYSRFLHLRCGHPAVTACSFTAGCPIAHARVELRFVNGPVIFWDLSRVPQDYGGGEGRRTTSTFDRLGDHSGSGSRYL
ncbi:unnamed protein product, partial [Staurois parvus]